MGNGGWERATATVKARRESPKFAWSKMTTRRRYEYAMEITPAGTDAPFTTTMITPMLVDRWEPLDEGNVVTVLHKSGTDDVKWDRSEPSTSRRAMAKAFEQEKKKADDDAFASALHEGIPGTNVSTSERPQDT